MSSMKSEDSLCGILNISSAERVQAHYDGARTHLLNSNEILRRTSHEQDLYFQYCQNGEVNGTTIYSSKGEHYTEVCPSLKHFLDNELKFDLKYFGYMEYAYGLEEHRTFFKKLLITTPGVLIVIISIVQNNNGLELVRKKVYVRQYLMNEGGYPSRSICTGPSTSYLLFEAPVVYLEDKEKSPSEISEEFSDDLYFATGVMLSGNLFSHSNLSSYVRIHLGSDPANIEEMMRRFGKAGLHYHMKHKFHSSSLSKKKNSTEQ